MTEPTSLAEGVAAARRDLAAGQHAAAWQTMASLLMQFPEEPRVMLETGLIGLRSGHAQEAAGVLHRLTEQQPDIAQGWVLFGEALMILGMVARALPVLEQAVRLLPDDARLLCLLGMAHQRNDNRDAAVASYRQAIARAPENPKINAAAGIELANLNADGDAITALSRAARAPSAPVSAQARLAGLLLQQSGFDAAQPTFDAAVGAMKANLQAGRIDEALRNEDQLERWFVRPIESEEHSERCFAAWRDAMTEAGAKAAASLPASTPVSRRAGGAIPIVGFFLHAASMLGHVELMLDYLAAMKAADTPQIEPRIYVFTSTHPGLIDEAKRLSLPLTLIEAECPSGDALPPYQKLLWLRERVARDGVEAMVWISVPRLTHFGAALGLAPINIFWALRFRSVVSAHVQGYVACASCFEREDVVNGRRWDVIPLAFRELAGPPRGEEAAAIRRQLGEPPLVFGTLARAEKMQGDAWLEAVGLALKACPQAVFLWTGRSEDPRVAGALREMGVADQSRFVGWVDTRLYAQVLDIFLDTAPVGCGMTAMEAMAWGKPLVSFKDPLTNWGQCLRPVLEGRVPDAAAKADIERIFALGSSRELLTWADTPQQYAALVRRLAEDVEYRTAVGAAGQAFTERYFGNPTYAAERFATIIRAVIKSARDGTGANG